MVFKDRQRLKHSTFRVKIYIGLASVFLLLFYLEKIIIFPSIQADDFARFQTHSNRYHIQHLAQSADEISMPDIPGKTYAYRGYSFNEVLENYPHEAHLSLHTDYLLTLPQTFQVSQAYNQKFDPRYREIKIYFAMNHPHDFEPRKYYAIVSYTGAAHRSEKLIKYASFIERLFIQTKAYLAERNMEKLTLRWKNNNRLTFP